MLEKISDTEYTVGVYSITKEKENWLVTFEGTHKALFFHRDEALRYTIIQYTCGYMVGKGMRELLKMAATEMRLDNE